MFMAGWDLLPGLIEPKLAALLQSLAHNPSRLSAALVQFPKTLVHGDLRIANIGVAQGAQPHAIFLDFARPSLSTPALDLIWYLGTSGSSLPISKEACISLYKQRLAQRLGSRFAESWWQPALELSLLAGFLMFACIWAGKMGQSRDEHERWIRRNELDWWSATVQAGAERILAIR